MGNFEGTFSTGLPFNFNPVNRDMRICGTAASLAGLEQGIKLKNKVYIDHAIKRVLLIYSMAMSAGGIPLIYLGDEIATLNDYSFRDDPEKKGDNRWAHRPYFDWERAEKRLDATTYEGRIYQGFTKMIQVRKSTPALGKGQTLFFDSGNKHIFSYIRNKRILILGNFSEFEQTIHKSLLSVYIDVSGEMTELLTGDQWTLNEEITLQPYQYVWLKFA